MELRQLRFLVTLAEELHFGRAAARMHISQPSLSQEIRRLEHELGVILFSRTSRQVQLTPIGAAILDIARQTLDAADRVGETARRLARGEMGTLRVGFVPTTAPALLPRLLRAHAKRYPEVEIDLYAAGLADPSAGLRSQRVDVALIWPPVDVPDLVLRTLLHEPRVVIMAADHPLAGSPRLRFDQVADLPVCVVETDDRTWRDFWLVNDIRQGRPPALGPAATSLDGCIAAVAAGRGIAFPPVGSKAFISGAPVVGLPVDGLPPAALAVAWPRSAVNPLIDGLAQLAEATAAELRPGTATHPDASATTDPPPGEHRTGQTATPTQTPGPGAAVRPG